MFPCTLLHEYLRVIRYDITIDNRSKGNVVAGWLDVLIHQFFVMFFLKTHHEFYSVLKVTAHLAGQHPGVLSWLETDGPAGQSCATLGDSPLEKTCRPKQQRGREERKKLIMI